MTIQNIENNLLADCDSYEEEKRMLIQSEVMQNILEKFEFVFSDILFSD